MGEIEFFEINGLKVIFKPEAGLRFLWARLFSP
jgi:hypothetical protein